MMHNIWTTIDEKHVRCECGKVVLRVDCMDHQLSALVSKFS